MKLFDAAKRSQTREADRQLRAQMLAHEKVSGLDFGVASAVYALSAAGGIPMTSCNAGCFGGLHREPFPLVGFYWHPYLLPLFKRCAEQARISVWVHVRGELVVGARTIGRLPALASALVQRKALINDAWRKI
ncbi:MAG: hypothetical protein J7493_00170 [Porphyrobacter sp.]|nr:hypothetical protein [Porphyrobacter sp.]